MARILAISSYVAHGHVGLGAIIPTMHALGHEVIAVPTVVLSCHYGYAQVGGFTVEPGQIDSLFAALDANAWLQSVDAVLTGYLPSLEVVDGVARVLERVGSERPDVLYLCDPVMGDDPQGLYVGEEVAAGIRDRLVATADIVTPNRFELAWLAGMELLNAVDADAAAEATGADLVAATSIPAGPDVIANVMSDDQEVLTFLSPLQTGVPHGTGDLFAALVLGHMLAGRQHANAVARASAGVNLVISQSIGRPELNLVATIRDAVASAPAPAEPIA